MLEVSTGFKGGGIGPRPFNPAQVQPFGPETLTNYELGLKTDLFDRSCGSTAPCSTRTTRTSS